MTKNAIKILEKNEIPDIGFLRLRDVLKIIPVSKSNWYAGIREGKYPPPIKLGSRSVWSLKKLKSYIEKIDAKNN